jgi:hypothetical protein
MSQKSDHQGHAYKGVYCILNDTNKQSLNTQYILNLGQLMETIHNIKKFLVKKLYQLRLQPLLI